MKILYDQLAALKTWDAEAIQSIVYKRALGLQIKPPIVIFAVKTIVAGSFVSPEPFPMMEALGKERVLRKLEIVIYGGRRQ